MFNIIDKISYGAFAIFYYAFVVLPLMTIKYSIKLFNLIAVELPQYLLFGIKVGGSFSDINVPHLFIRLAIISTFIFVILFVISGVKVGFQKEQQENPIRIALRNSVIGTLWILALPVLLYGLNLLFGVMFDLILGGSVESIDRAMFKSWFSPDRFPNSSLQEFESIANNNYSIDYDLYRKIFNVWGSGVQFVMIGSFASIATLIPLVLGLLTLIQKIFEQFFLFVISPFVAAASVSDDGKRMKQWQEMYFAKSIVILGFLVSIQMFGIFIVRSVTWSNGLEIQEALKLLLSTIIIIGGSVAAMSMSSLIASFVGESASIRETISTGVGNMKSMVALAGGAIAAGKAFTHMTKGATKKLSNPFAKTKLGQKMSAKKKLKSAYKSGAISKDEYKNQKKGLNDLFDQNKEDSKEANSEMKNYNNQILQDIESGNSTLTKSDIHSSTNSLISQEKDITSQMNKIQKSGLNENNIQQYEKLQAKHKDLSQLIDKRIENKGKKSLFNKEEVMSNYQRRRGTLTNEAATAVDNYKLNKLGNKFEKHKDAIIASGQSDFANNILNKHKNSVGETLAKNQKYIDIKNSNMDAVKKTLEATNFKKGRK